MELRVGGGGGEVLLIRIQTSLDTISQHHSKSLAPPHRALLWPTLSCSVSLPAGCVFCVSGVRNQRMPRHARFLSPPTGRQASFKAGKEGCVTHEPCKTSHHTAPPRGQNKTYTSSRPTEAEAAAAPSKTYRAHSSPPSLVKTSTHTEQALRTLKAPQTNSATSTPHTHQKANCSSSSAHNIEEVVNTKSTAA